MMYGIATLGILFLRSCLGNFFYSVMNTLNHIQKEKK